MTGKSICVTSVLLLSLVFVSSVAFGGTDTVVSKPDPWEKAILAFEEQDRQQPPPQGAILFVGSSTIRIWDLKRDFPDLTTINRGFGGSHFADTAHYLDRIVIPYHPKIVVLYAGDNDIAQGKTPEQVFSDFQAIVKGIEQALPDTRLIALSIKPSVARWDKYDKMQQVNAWIADMGKKDPRIVYVETGKCLLGEDGKPRPDLFLKDGLHLNPQGYALWASILKPIVNANEK
jgi:lysophospholipase L1-like esterase